MTRDKFFVIYADPYVAEEKRLSHVPLSILAPQLSYFALVYLMIFAV